MRNVEERERDPKRTGSIWRGRERQTETERDREMREGER